MTSKFFIYRNLHRGADFSVRYRGRVIHHLDELIAENVTFKVNEMGRQRCLREKQKNVHAFVVAENYIPYASLTSDGRSQICYDPYTAGQFICDGHSITQAASVLFLHGKCYLIER